MGGREGKAENEPSSTASSSRHPGAAKQVSEYRERRKRTRAHEEEVPELDCHETRRDHPGKAAKQPPPRRRVQDRKRIEHDDDGDDNPCERVGGRVNLVWPEVVEGGPEEEGEDEVKEGGKLKRTEVSYRGEGKKDKRDVPR